MPRPLLLLACVFAMLTSAAPAHAIPPSDAIARINALRAANSLPPLTEDADLNAGCQAHARYMALNGGWDEPVSHDETPGKPGYSAAGAQAARSSVLAGALGWMDPHPWVASAEHTRQIMDPELQRTGYGEDRGWMCLYVGKEARPDLIGKVFTLPGAAAIDVNLADGEGLSVYTPGQDDITVRSPQLSSSQGAVGLSETLVPRAPLAPGTTYTAEVELRHSSARCSREGAPPVYPACPTRFASWCYASEQDIKPVWLPAEAAPYDPVLCSRGQKPPATEYATVKARSVPYFWQFTTAGAPVTCPSGVTAPSRLARGATMNVHVQLCGATSVSVEVLRGTRRVGGRTSRMPGFRVSTRGLAPGRYSLVVTVGNDTHQHEFLVRV
ncbi:CAP domain-containing protein [Solirubrobacter phytolaccae]|uniref:CAP domain-containing protein n=1 Tax=Solirubrobacter phytolaccae TaxID=1404360 RepID=A0A9X3SBW2_9ACTN|nr:CAP domain-containing protein [Solirubrobacter phytolaccae]MDA0183966.1 CAP domain-containing protein [Solirubrobacter phytolaccae]